MSAQHRPNHFDALSHHCPRIVIIFGAVSPQRIPHKFACKAVRALISPIYQVFSDSLSPSGAVSLAVAIAAFATHSILEIKSKLPKRALFHADTEAAESDLEGEALASHPS